MEKELLTYEDVEITDEQVSKLIVDEDFEDSDESDEQPGEAENDADDDSSEQEESETSDNPEDESESDDDENKEEQTYEVNGEVLTIKDLVDGHLRLSDYTKKTTEVKEQMKTLAEKQSSLDGLLSVVSKIKGNSDLKALLIETISDELDAESAKLFEKSLEMEKVENPEVAEMKSKLERFEAEHKANEAQKQMEIKLRTLAKNEGVDFSMVQEAYDFAVERFQKSDGKEVITVETALKVIRSEKASKENSSVEKKKIVRKGTPGMKKVKNKTPKSYDDIDFDMDELLSS